ncbi:MAG: GNAT family N-acetyltransferase, partial [Eubacterium sp.]
IAVVCSARGTGCGAFLVKSLCQMCKKQNIHTVYVDSQLHAVGFYEKLGFRSTGEPTVIDRGIEHLPMICEG